MHRARYGGVAQFFHWATAVFVAIGGISIAQSDDLDLPDFRFRRKSKLLYDASKTALTDSPDSSLASTKQRRQHQGIDVTEPCSD
jgi:hypothetical protein